MAYPGVVWIELPILQELVAMGGREDVRFLYERLVAYFPQLGAEEVRALGNGRRSQWRRVVQRAGRSLAEKREIERVRGRWTITALGRKRVAAEELRFSLAENGASALSAVASRQKSFSHAEVQQMLLDIGRVLGYYAQREVDYYDVVWRASEASPRLSHVFEVQRRGSIDGALAKLKRAYETQRSKPFLIVTSERDTRRAERQLSLRETGPFHEIGAVTTLLSFEQLHRLHHALSSVEDLLAKVFE